MKVLVTGASGFIGGRIAEKLAENPDFKVLATGRSKTEKFQILPQIQYFQSDLTQKMTEIDCEICIHSAGLADDKSTENELNLQNIEATANLLGAIPNCKIFIFISSSSVYDFSEISIKYESDADIRKPISGYGKSKFNAEKIIENAQIPAVYILRPRAVYGRGDRILIPRILKLIKNNRMIIPWPLSRETSLTNIENLIEIVLKCIRINKKGINIYNVSDDYIYDLNEIFSIILKRKSSSAKLVKVPISIIKIIIFITGLLKIKANLTKQSLDYITLPSVLAIEKAKKELNFEGKFNFFNSLDNLEI